MNIDMNVIDIVLVVSLSFLALSAIVFLSFFIPVLVQLAKVLESMKVLLDLVNSYVEGIQNKLNSATDSVGKVMSYVSNLGSALTNGLLNMFSSKKK